jgi:hypothetical protein
MQRASILYMTGAVSASSFMADFYVFSTFPSLEYAISSVSNILAYSMHSCDNAENSAKKEAIPTLQ